MDRRSLCKVTLWTKSKNRKILVPIIKTKILFGRQELELGNNDSGPPDLNVVEHDHNNCIILEHCYVYYMNFTRR